MAARGDVSLCAVGDVTAFREHPELMFDYAGPVLRSADITFCQNERHYTDRFTEEHDLLPGIHDTEVTAASHAEALRAGGFKVVSFASNHCLDLGPNAMLDTISALRNSGCAVIGAGENIKAARESVIIESSNTRVAFLG